MIRMVVSIGFLFVSSLYLAACGLEASNSHEVIQVQAAASLKDAMAEITQNFIKKEGLDEDQIIINLAGSGTLRQQIESGAPATIFVSADQKNMDLLVEKDLVTDVEPLLRNELVLISPANEPPVTLDTLPQAHRIIVGNVDTVPAGRYAKEVLDRVGVWPMVESQLVYVKDVRAVVTYISRGAGQAGFVYKTDALLAGSDVQITEAIDPSLHSPIIYPIARVKKYDSPLARRFYTYLRGPEAGAVFSQYGFSPLAQ